MTEPLMVPGAFPMNGYALGPEDAVMSTAHARSNGEPVRVKGLPGYLAPVIYDYGEAPPGWRRF